jgi:hypothetical protein
MAPPSNINPPSKSKPKPKPTPITRPIRPTPTPTKPAIPITEEDNFSRHDTIYESFSDNNNGLEYQPLKSSLQASEFIS